MKLTQTENVVSLAEKYRPRTLDEIVGQDKPIAILKNIVSTKQIPHLMLVGPPGSGKTTAAHAFARAVYKTDNTSRVLLELNASNDRGIDAVREKIKANAQMKGSHIIFLDEADSMTREAQDAMKRIMETSPDAHFIFSGNDESKFLDPIKSRCAIIRFNPIDRTALARRVLEICKAEGIEVTRENMDGIRAMVDIANGDMRHALNLLQTIITEGKKLNTASIIEMCQPCVSGIALTAALDGDFETAREKLEDAYIHNNFNVDRMIKELSTTIAGIKDTTVKIKLYAELGELEVKCKTGTPLVQMVAFMAKAWIIPHMPKGCPAMQR